MKSHQDVLTRLQQRLLHHSDRIGVIREKLSELAQAYWQYVDFERELESHRENLVNILRLLGPKRADTTTKADRSSKIHTITKDVSASELCRKLPIWKSAREYLREAGESKVGDIQDFLAWLGREDVTRQAIESALKLHSNTFAVSTKGHERVVRLKKR